MEIAAAKMEKSMNGHYQKYNESFWSGMNN